MEIEDEVEFTNIVKILVQNFDEEMNDFQDQEFVVVLVHNGDEIQTGIPFVDYFVVVPFQKVTGFCVSR